MLTPIGGSSPGGLEQTPSAKAASWDVRFLFVQTMLDHRPPSSDHTPEALPDLRWTNWRFAVYMAFGVIGACYLLSMALPAWLFHSWSTSPDLWWTTNSAQWVSHGAIGTVYEANPWYSALPGYLILYAPVVALGDHLGLVTNYPIHFAYPSMWLVSGPFFFVTSATCTLGVDYLADTLYVSPARRRVLSITISLLVVVPTAFYAGHPEDLLALALSCLALSLLFRKQVKGAALVLAVAIMMQTWAVLLLPVLVAASPAGQRLKSAIRASALPALVGLLLLALDFRYAVKDLLDQPMVNLGQHLPWWSLARRMTVSYGSNPKAPTIHATAGASTRILAVLIAMAVAVLVVKDNRPGRVMTACAIALLARGVFETEIWTYYLAPAAVFLALLLASQSSLRTKQWVIGGLATFTVYAGSAGAYGLVVMPPLVALALLVVSGMVALGMGAGMSSAILLGGISRIRSRRLDVIERPAA
jgi:hypothetical protein